MRLKQYGRMLAVILLAGAVAAPALADVRTGVEAWSRGDYAAAVREWDVPASEGDPDALFNLAQAYRLGRGVATDLDRAERLYARAAASGHVQAADTYGLMLFQDGRRKEALPYVTSAASRGDARSQYLLGIAHFNGDLVEKDWVRAYALLILANDAGLPQAGEALAQMDGHVPLAERQQAAALAIDLRGEADAARAAELAAAELAGPSLAAAETSPAPRRGISSAGVPRPIASVAVSPSVSAARAAVAEASRATGADSPAEAGTELAEAAPRAGAAPTAAPAATPAGTPAARSAPKPRPAAAAAGNGPWRVQLGAFSVRSNAEQLWQRLSQRSELSGARRLLVSAGAVTKLQAGGYASRSAADAACRTLKRSGHDCLVTRG